MRCRAFRCWSNCRTSPPHCGDGLLKIEKNPELSHPIRRDCATSRSTSNCWRLTISSVRRICSARAGSALPRSRLASWASSRWQTGVGDCACVVTRFDTAMSAPTANVQPGDPLMCVHSSLKTMPGRALSLMRSRDFRKQVPQHAGNNDQGGKQDKNVQPLAVEYPADYSD